MKRAVKRIGLIGTAGLLLAALAAADRPSLLSRTSAGLWELSGIPGAGAAHPVPFGSVQPHAVYIG